MASTSLDQASDNNVAEIMDAEDPLLFYIRLVLLVNQKGWCIPQLDTWCILPTPLKMFSTIRTMIFLCTADIGWITGHSYILYGPLLNGNYRYI
jgi:acetyl-CoA synthetase